MAYFSDVRSAGRLSWIKMDYSQMNWNVRAVERDDA
jgi:hypothetical protein